MDRNRYPLVFCLAQIGSLSARRAWIEMFCATISLLEMSAVALRKESVDRNILWTLYWIGWNVSLSARRAWIEIRPWQLCQGVWRSLSARRAWIEIPVQQPENTADERRSPQGERG